MKSATLPRPLPIRFPRPAALALAMVLLTAALWPAAPARADTMVDKVNAMYAVLRKDARTEVPLPQEMRSDLILLPAMAAMEAPPAALDDREKAALLPPTSRDWEAVAAWAQGAPQKAVLEALRKATQSEDAETHMVFAQPYGIEGVSVELVGADLYTELGDPPTLAAADFKYLTRMEWVQCLAHVEANRLAAEGKTPEAMELMVHWLFFARQLADRVMLKEKLTGMRMMGAAMVHLRDLAYRDFKAQTHTATIDSLVDIVKRLDDRKSPLGLERLLTPAGERYAGEQLIGTLYDTRSGEPLADKFGARLARISTGPRPLRLFSEAAKWDQLRPVSAKWLVMNDTNSKVASDYAYRWGLSYFDPALTGESDYQRMVAEKPPFQLLTIIYSQFPKLFTVRQDLRVEAAGCRMSLAMYAFYLRNNQLPPALTAVRPAFAPSIDQDPFSQSPRALEYLIPVRDDPTGPRGERSAHEMNVFPGNRHKPFAVKLGDPDKGSAQSEFVIYSIGADGDKGAARDVCGGTEDLKSGDYLLWPPVVSLLRQHLVQEGQLP